MIQKAEFHTRKDKSANVRVVIRGTYASRFTMQIAEEKVNAVIMSGTDTAAFIANRADIRKRSTTSTD